MWLDRPSPSRNQAWTSVQVAHRSKLPISPISPNANQSKVPVQFAHRSAALAMRSSPPSPPCRRPPSPQPRTHSLAHHLLSRASCSLLGMARHGLLHPLAPPRLAHDSAAAARPPTTSSLVIPRAHGRLHEHARGTPALPTRLPTLTRALIPALKPALTTAAHRAHSEPTCSPQVRAACDHPTQLSAAGRGRHPISAAEGIGRTVHRAARVRPST